METQESDDFFLNGSILLCYTLYIRVIFESRFITLPSRMLCTFIMQSFYLKFRALF